jgi:hypothetical protein
LVLLHRRAPRTHRRVHRAVEQFAGWYFSRAIQGYTFLQTGEMPPSVVRDRLKLAVAKLKVERERIMNDMRLRRF